jgi:hypothetical protein
MIELIANNMKKICAHCGIQFASDDIYCTRQCFDKAIDTAIENDTRTKQRCKIRTMICDLRDDAEKRVNNLDSYGANKLLKTKEYFQARADVLNDLLMVMAPDTPCLCC